MKVLSIVGVDAATCFQTFQSLNALHLNNRMLKIIDGERPSHPDKVPFATNKNQALPKLSVGFTWTDNALKAVTKSCSPADGEVGVG